jgi:uncharacterized protein YaiE (UPF0345 family)
MVDPHSQDGFGIFDAHQRSIGVEFVLGAPMTAHAPACGRYRPRMETTSHNVYFEGGVQSLGFATPEGRATVGVISPGTYEFDTDAPERMTVVTGSLEVCLDGTEEWSPHPKGDTFVVPGSSRFQVRAEQPSAYLCEFL